MKFFLKTLKTFVDLPKDWIDLMEDVGLEVKTVDGDIINLELLANRGDHYCYMGLAREISGRTGGKITIPKSTPVMQDDHEYDADSKYIKTPGQKHLFELETDKCIAFSLTPYKFKKHVKTPANYTEMLTASGVNVILPAIDVTNVVLLEYGQPAHIYDADKIVGKIHVRETKKGEMAALLFHEGMTELPAGTVVIADDEKILCVGGVIGCHGADVDENTTNILFETALFDPVSIRRTERALLEKPTIAAQIFERGGDISAICAGAARAHKLYSDMGWEPNGQFCFARSKRIEKQYIEMSGDYVRNALEIKITDKEIDERLARYGFEKTPGGYMIPTWRVWDIKGTRADLIEELCRSIGYNNLSSRLPQVTIGAEPTSAQLRKSEIDSYMVHNGFYEVFTDNLYSPKHANMSPVADHIALENSVDGGYAFMKNNAIVQAAELVAKNINVKNREIRCYEWGKVFQKDGEHNVLWGVMNGAKISPLDVKGLLENLMKDLGIEYSIEYGNAADFCVKPCIHPTRCGKIVSKGREICIFGEIHPVLLAEWDIKNDLPVIFEFFDCEELLNLAPRKIKYESPSATIASVRDVSVAVPYGKHAGDVAEFILKNFKEIADVKIADVFEKPKESVRNVTYTLAFVPRDFKTDEINALIVKIMQDATDFIK